MAFRPCLTAVVCMSFLSTDSLMTQRKHEAAIETRRLSVLPDYEKILGDHPFVATTLSWIANSYHALGDYDNAINATRRALEIQEKFLGGTSRNGEVIVRFGRGSFREKRVRKVGGYFSRYSF